MQFLRDFRDDLVETVDLLILQCAFHILGAPGRWNELRGSHELPRSSPYRR